MATDPYAVLGLNRSATDDDIRRAFRTLAKKLHPDVNPGDQAAAERFKQVSQAYDLLGDPDKIRRRIAERNLAACLPELDAAERERLLRDSFRALARMLIDSTAAGRALDDVCEDPEQLRDSIARMLVCLGQLVVEVPTIAALEINPLSASADAVPKGIEGLEGLRCALPVWQAARRPDTSQLPV
mgnify:CR=1 FL=1